MPTMPERMAVVETEVRVIKNTVVETDRKVDELIAWRNEERGAKAQRSATNRKIIGVASVLGSIGGVVSGFILKTLGGT